MELIEGCGKRTSSKCPSTRSADVAARQRELDSFQILIESGASPQKDIEGRVGLYGLALVVKHVVVVATGEDSSLLGATEYTNSSSPTDSDVFPASKGR